MKVEFDSMEKPETLRAVAAFALMLAGDIDVPSVRDEVPHGASTNAHGTREMFLPPNELPRSIAGKDAPNVVPFPPAPPVPVVPLANSLATHSANAPDASKPWLVPGLPPTQSYVSPAFPPSQSLANSAGLPPLANAPTAADAAIAVSASSSGPIEYDKAGLPWDERIHNKGRTKKKDGTWKLQKGLDPIVAQTVVAELAAKRVTTPTPIALPLPPNFEPRTMPPGPTLGVSPLPPTGGPLQPDPTAEARAAYGRVVGMMPELGAPYTSAMQASAYSNVGSAPGYSGVSASSQVPLPPTMPNQYPVAGQPPGTLPVPPFPGSSGSAMVPPSSVAAPVPSAPQPGAVGGVSPPVSGYKQLIDKLTAATQNKSLNPALVAPTVQRFGVPNMGMLGDPSYAGLLPAISQEFDRLIAGGAPSGP